MSLVSDTMVVQRGGETMLNFNSILIFSDNAKKLSEFYHKVFGKEAEWSGGDYAGWQVGAGYIVIGPHDKVKNKNKNPERLMFNFETNDVKGEFERIKGLGGKSIAAPYHPDEDKAMEIATLADPDGNYFQLATPMK